MMRYLLIAALLAAAPVVAPANCWQTTRVGTGYVGYCVKGTGPTVVIVNGGPGLSSAYVAPIVDWLAEHGFRAVRFDERDVGHSSGFAASDVTLAGEVADVEAIRRALGISRIIVLAHSFGGTIAQAYAEQDSSRVARLLMLDVVPTNSRDYRAASSRVERRMTHAQIAEYRVWSTKQALAKNPREAGLHIFDAFIPADFVNQARAVPFLALIARDHNFSFISETGIGGSAPRLHALRFSGPTAFIVGESDPVGAEATRRMAARAHATLSIVPRAGHFPWLENAAAFYDALARALRG